MPEQAFDDLSQLSALVCQVPIALVSLVERERLWPKSVVGLPFPQAVLATSLCAYAMMENDVFVIPDASKDSRFSSHAIVTGYPQVRMFAGAPLRTNNGKNLGTLCILDMQPRQLTDVQVGALRALRRQVEAQLELKRSNIKAERREAVIREQHDSLVKIQAQKEELTALVVHDLKNPLSSVIPNATLLARDARLAPDARGIAADILTSSKGMLRLVMNLLDISRAEDGALVPRKEAIDVSALIEEVRGELTSRAAQEGRRFGVSMLQRAGVVQADRDLLKRVIQNLADNALKYTPKGGAIRIEAHPDPDGKHLELRVCDDGPGIPEANRATIFEKYSRLDRDATNHHTGSRGLGLTFCRLAVEAHGGKIWVQDGVPRGSAFCIKLPRGG